MLDHHPHSRTGLYDQIDRDALTLNKCFDIIYLLRAEVSAWRNAHDELVAIRHQDLTALHAKIQRLENELANAKLTGGPSGPSG